MSRYTRHLTSWLRARAGSFDVIMADWIREESAAVIEAARAGRCASIVRLGGWGTGADPSWWNTNRLGRRYGSIGKQADAVIAKSAACNRALIAAGYASSRVHRIDTGFAAGPIRSAGDRHLARQALAEINSDLRTGTDTPVIVCTAPMVHEGGIGLLVQAARHIVAAVSDVRIWFIGDGPHRDWIYEHLRGDGIRASIAMPGSFCNMEDVFAAADLFVQTDDFGLDHFLPTAVSADLPIVAVDTESTRAVLAMTDSTDSVAWVHDPTAVGLRKRILETLADLPQSRDRASSIRRNLLRNRPQTTMIDDYVDLMRRVAATKSDIDRNPPAQAMS